MDDPLVLWVLGLFAFAAFVVAIEFFVPSGGLLSAVALLSALAGVVVAFRISAMSGLTASGVVLVSIPTTFWLFVKVFPSTPVGRLLILDDGTEDQTLGHHEYERHKDTKAITALIGARGTALTDLRPGGTVRIDGEDLEAFAEVGMIDANAEVEVIRIIGRQIRVKAVGD